MFDRDADETIRWMVEKDAVVLSEDFGHDLPSIQALQRDHAAGGRDLEALRVQVGPVRISI